MAIIAGSSGLAVAAADTPVPPKSQRAAEIRIGKGISTFPIVMVQEFPFVEGSVDGVKGKFMLDTGSEQALIVNDHRIPIAGGRTIGTGHFGSGETFAVQLVPQLRNIRIGNAVYPRATIVPAQDARMLEEITPDFSGWLGFDAWANRALKLDYRRSRATFYEGGKALYLKGERTIAVLPFEIRKLPNHPLMPARLGDMDVVTAWDSGQYGTLFTSEAGRARLLKEGRLTRSAEPDTFDLHGLRINSRIMPDVVGIRVETTPFAAAPPIGISEPNVLTMGYAFLRQYKTVWDFRSRSLYLLAR